jgi:phosphoserine phosphatase RsbU/P
LLAAFVVALGAFAGANALERLLIRLAAGSPWGFAYVSDTVLSLLMLAATYLWLHVRNLRAQLTALERERVAADTELALAARIQRTALDGVAPPSAGLLWFAETRPAGVVGGDFYDLVTLDDGATLILVADVSGKGVPAAIGLASARAAFRMMSQNADDPAEIARRWSRWLHTDTGGTPYLTALLIRLAPDRRQLSYINAGHPPGLLLSLEREIRLAPTCQPLGLMPTLEVTTTTVEYPLGALGVLITDGVSEALENGCDAIDRVAAMARGSLARTPQEITQALLDAAHVSNGGRLAPPDDQTVVAFKVED